MRRFGFVASWAFVGASIAVACGGSSDTDLFGAPGDASASSSGTTTSSSGDATSGSSGTTTSSGGTTSSSGGTTTSSSGASGTVDAGTDATKDAGTDAGKACNRNNASDCGDGEYCKVTNCAATGMCTKRPTVPSNGGTPDIVCGCDGVSYWSADLAASFGVSVNPAFVAQCQGGFVRTCSIANDCPKGRFCNYQTTANGSGVCAITTAGSCWGLPESCPPLANGRAKECGSDSCETFCEAVKAEKAWFEESAMKCN